jgi:hypothetical protein
MRQDFPSPFRQPGRRLPTFDVSSLTRIDSSGVESRSVRAVAAVAAGRGIVVDMNDTGVLNRPSLRQRRLAAGITLQAIAERAGVSYSMVHLLDRGYQPERSDVRAKVLAALEQLERPTQTAAAA